MDDENLEREILPTYKPNNREKVLSKLQDMEEDEYVSPAGFSAESFLPSSMLVKKNKNKENKEEKSKEDEIADDWFSEMMALSGVKIKSKKRKSTSIFDSSGLIDIKKKKKKKKKDKNEMIDYRKEFEPESALYKNLLIEQSRFTEDLQKEYDAIKSSKSSSRGITKQLTDLVDNITQARSLAMQLVDKQVNLKKQAADLNLKQKKELGQNEVDGSLSDFASSYLKNMLNERQALFNGGTGDGLVSDYDSDEMFDEISSNVLGRDEYEVNDEAEKFLKYENANVTVYVVITNDNIDDFEYEAYDEDGNIIPDYPEPTRVKISVNRSTNIATDAYGKKFPIIWRENNENDPMNLF